MPSVQRRKPDDADSITTMRIRQPDTSSTTPQVGMSQRRKPDDADSTIVMRIRPHQRGFDNHDTSSTTPQVGMSQRRKPDDADLNSGILFIPSAIPLLAAYFLYNRGRKD